MMNLRPLRKPRARSTHRGTISAFAKKHDLIYFDFSKTKAGSVAAIQGSTVSPDQEDSNYAMGTHAGYDIMLLQRTASVVFPGYTTTKHSWYVMQIDLNEASNLPYIFIGTQQQTKAHFAKVLTSHREARHMELEAGSPRAAEFHANYVILASPGELSTLHRLFTPDIIDMMAAHHYPFCVEIQGDSLVIITEADKPSKQLLDELLHYGLWMAKTIDKRLD